MITVQVHPCREGARVHVSAVCIGFAHMGDPCPTRAVTTIVPSARVEGLGYALALEETLQDVWVQYPGLLELAEH